MGVPLPCRVRDQTGAGRADELGHHVGRASVYPPALSLPIPAQLTRLPGPVESTGMTFARNDMGKNVSLIAPIQARFTNPVDVGE